VQSCLGMVQLKVNDRQYGLLIVIVKQYIVAVNYY